MSDHDKSEAVTMGKNETTNSIHEVDEKGRDHASSQTGSEFDLFAYHEHNAGRLVIDPE